MAHNKKFGKAAKSAGVPESRRTKEQKEQSPLHFDWSKGLDYAQTGLTAVGMIPGIGNLADAANVAVSGGRAAYAKATGDDEAFEEHRNSAAINAAAMIPGAGLAVGAGKLAKAGVAAAKGAKGVKGASQSAKVVKKAAEQKTKSKLAHMGESAAREVGATVAEKVVNKKEKAIDKIKKKTKFA